MKPLFSLLVCFLLSTCAIAQVQHLKIPSQEEGMVDVEVLSANTFIAAEKWNRKLYKTTDGGLTWTAKVVETQFGGSNVSLSFPSENVGYVHTTELVNGGVYSPGGTQIDQVYKTADGGDSWTRVTPGNNDPFQTSSRIGSLFFFTEDVGLCSLSDTLWRTIDGGDSWHEIGEFPTSMSVDYHESGIAYLTASWNFDIIEEGIVEVYYTEDFGANWEVIPLPNIPLVAVPTEINLHGNKAYIIHGTHLTILEDGTWIEDKELPFRPMAFIGGAEQLFLQTRLTSTRPPKIRIDFLKSDDFGATMETLGTIDNGYIYLQASDSRDQTGVAVGTGGNVIIFRDESFAISPIETAESIPLQVFPNPIRLGEDIQIRGLGGQEASWNLYNALGQEIAQGLTPIGRISTAGLQTTGLYVLEVHIESASINTKILIQN